MQGVSLILEKQPRIPVQTKQPAETSLDCIFGFAPCSWERREKRLGIHLQYYQGIFKKSGTNKETEFPEMKLAASAIQIVPAMFAVVVLGRRVSVIISCGNTNNKTSNLQRNLIHLERYAFSQLHLLRWKQRQMIIRASIFCIGSIQGGCDFILIGSR